METIRLIQTALAEDIGPGDITTDSLIPEGAVGRGVIVAKEPLIPAGIEVARQVFACLDPEAVFTARFQDGQAMASGDILCEISGRLRAMLKGERTALNFLQRLSGIATLTRYWSEALEGTSARLVDTRKTTPGLRVLEKYAVRVGGARNHRFGLFDGVLIKDNHIVACGGIFEAVTRARQAVHHLIRIEVEVSDPDEAEQAVTAGADVIMLDNMTAEAIAEAAGRIGGRAVIEVSGSVTRERLRSLAEAGADLISAGSLTHSARAVDLSMRIIGD